MKASLNCEISDSERELSISFKVCVCLLLPSSRFPHYIMFRISLALVESVNGGLIFPGFVSISSDRSVW